MDIIPLDLAFTRLGADVTGRLRPLCATAQDGSLVLVCKASGFTRPGTGVLRYSAKLSDLPGMRTEVEALRAGLGSATSARTPVRLIVQSPSTGRSASRIHARADLVGSVAGFDGDAYVVDFVRETVADPVAPPRPRRKR